MKILTYNIRRGLGADGRKSLRRIAEVIRESGADIACLQEVEQRVRSDQPKRLGELLTMHAEFQAALRLKVYNFGNLILSRYPVIESARHCLTSAREQRGVLEVRLSTDLGPLSVLCTHWGLNADERMAQARETALLLNTCASPKVLCGDLNEADDCVAVHTLIDATGLVDITVQAGPVELTFPSDNPRARIDYILASPNLVASDVRVISSLASDHRPVVATVGRAEA